MNQHAMKEAVMSLLDAGQKIKAVKTCRDMTGWSLVEAKSYVDDLVKGEWKAKKVIAKLPKPVVSSPHDSKEADVFEIEKMTEAEPVKLATATKLYQPVRGSGASSRYFVIGISTDQQFIVGCRIGTNGKVSIRVEGPGLESEDARLHLKAVGFSNVDEAYGSFHVGADTAILQAKAIGATLLGITTGWATPLPDVTLIVGKGS